MGALTAVCCGLLVASCGQQKKREQGVQQYKTTVVTKKDMTLQRQYSARLTGRQIVEIRPQVSGCITRICINEGENVRKGQLLFAAEGRARGERRVGEDRSQRPVGG